MTTTITVYGADWCDDTRRALRQLRRLGVAHRYLNVDEDLDALDEARTLQAGERRTPVIDLGLGGEPLVEPRNDQLTGALVEMSMLTRDDLVARASVQNVGDMERVGRTVAGAAILAGASTVPHRLCLPLALVGAVVALSGLTGWCPVYHWTGRTSLGGPGDRPAEADRVDWLARRLAPQCPVAQEVPR